MTFLRKFYQILEGRRLLLSLSVACGLLFALTNLVPPLLSRELIRGITEGRDAASRFTLVELSAALLGVYALRGLSRYGYGRFSHVAAYSVMHDLMIRSYRHIQSLPHRFFSHERSGSLIGANRIGPASRRFVALPDEELGRIPNRRIILRKMGVRLS